MKEKEPTAGPCWRGTGTRGQHKRVIIIIFFLNAFVILNDYNEQERGRTTEQLSGMIQFRLGLTIVPLDFLRYTQIP